MSAESKQQKECEICWNSFNKSTRYKVTCPSCSLHACRECVKRYLLSSSELPHCMNPDCKSAWDRAFIIDACTYTFVNKKYKEHRTKRRSRITRNATKNERFAAEIKLE